MTVFKNHGFPLQGRLMNHGDIFLNSVGQFGKDGIRTTVEGLQFKFTALSHGGVRQYVSLTSHILQLHQSYKFSPG